MMTSPSAMSLVAIVPRRALLLLSFLPLFLRLLLFFVLVEVGSAPAGASTTRPTRTSEWPPEARSQLMSAEPAKSTSSPTFFSCFLAVETERKRTRSSRERARSER